MNLKGIQQIKFDGINFKVIKSLWFDDTSSQTGLVGWVGSGTKDDGCSAACKSEKSTF